MKQYLKQKEKGATKYWHREQAVFAFLLLVLIGLWACRLFIADEGDGSRYLINHHHTVKYFRVKSRLTKVCLSYNMSDNETPPISRVLIGQHLIFHSLTSPLCCNSPGKCTPVKYKKRQKSWVSKCHINTLLYISELLKLADWDKRPNSSISRKKIQKLPFTGVSKNSCFWLISKNYNKTPTTEIRTPA